MMVPLVGGLSTFLVVAGACCLYEYTLYSRAQLSLAPRLSRAYLAVVGLVIATGLAGAVAALLDVTVPRAAFVGFAVVSALPALVQYRLHQKIGVERGPLYDRVSERWF